MTYKVELFLLLMSGIDGMSTINLQKVDGEGICLFVYGTDFVA